MAGLLPPEFAAVCKRHFRQCYIQRDSPHEPFGFQDVVLNPGGNAAGEDKNQRAFARELRVPCVLEIGGERRIIRPHPGDFVKEDDGPGVFGNGRVQSVEGFWPAVRLRLGKTGRLCEPFAEIGDLLFIRHSLVRSEAFDFDETAFAQRREPLDQRGFSDASASRDDCKGGRVLPPERGQNAKIIVAADEHHASPCHTKSMVPRKCRAVSCRNGIYHGIYFTPSPVKIKKISGDYFRF